MNEIRIRSWNELQDRLFEDAWRPDLQRFRSRFVFRGLSDAAYRLETGLVRLGGRFAEMEPHLLRNFRKYAQRNLVERDSAWHWLALAQHHGLPTRLLDWTMSPLIAAHFATSQMGKFGLDGAIWAVDYVAAHKHLPVPLQVELEKEGAQYFTAEMLSRVAHRIEDLDALADSPFVLFFEPPSLDDRIVNQFALFSVMSHPKASLDAWLEAHPDLGRKIILPAEVKWEVRDKLDQANITERVLFPGLDGLSSWLKRYYGPRR